ncbi:hypothetical protein PTKIN_Ptkin16aG0111000 [Pterospermum kingtungense]
MALSDSNHPYKTYVHTLPENYCEDDKSLESPVITFKCIINANLVTNKLPDKFIPIREHYSTPEFQHHLTDDGQLTRDFLSNKFANPTIIPFSMGNLHWKKRANDKEWVPLVSTDDVVTSLLNVCDEMVSEYSGRKKLCLLVYIRKEVTVPHHEYLAMINAKQAEENLQQTLQHLEYMCRGLARGWRFSPLEWELMVKEIQEAGLGNSVEDACNIITERAMRESREQETKKRTVPADETSIQALEKVIYGPGGSKYSEDKCSVCLKEMLLGSQVTRMPCSHVFHEDCIVPWLKINHVCPLCRYQLSTT